MLAIADKLRFFRGFRDNTAKTSDKEIGINQAQIKDTELGEFTNVMQLSSTDNTNNAGMIVFVVCLCHKLYTKLAGFD